MSKYVVKMDYCTMAFVPDSISLSRLSSLLAGDTDLHWLRLWKNSDSDRSPVHSPLGLYYNDFCGSAQNPHLARISGVGCEHFRSTLPALFNQLETGGDAAHITRLDFCFDVLMSKSEWRMFLSNAFAHQLATEDTRKAKRYVVVANGDASTVYIGSRSSDRYFRIYNKTLEDPQYKFRGADGTLQDVPDGSFVIRYEIEFKRKTRTKDGQNVTLNLKPYFSDYYCSGSWLCDEIKRVWLSFGADVALPSGFEDAELLTDIHAYNIPVLNGDTISTYQESAVYSDVKARFDLYPHEFENKLAYAADKFGKYVPFILQNDELFKHCLSRAYTEFGFDTPIFVEFGGRGKVDFVELDEPESVLFPCSVPEYENIDIFKERGLPDESRSHW